MLPKEIVKRLVKLQVLTVRWVERNTSLRCSTIRDMERILTRNKLTCTYGLAVKNLREEIIKHCKDSCFVTEINDLEKIINESDIKDLRFGLEPQRKFSDDERELDGFKMRYMLYLTDMVDIKYVANKFNLKESTVKQACQQERLKNTRKIGKSWEVNVYECMDLWNIPQKEDNLYFKMLK